MEELAAAKSREQERAGVEGRGRAYLEERLGGLYWPAGSPGDLPGNNEKHLQGLGFVMPLWMAGNQDSLEEMREAGASQHPAQAGEAQIGGEPVAEYLEWGQRESSTMEPATKTTRKEKVARLALSLERGRGEQAARDKEERVLRQLRRRAALQRDGAEEWEC